MSDFVLLTAGSVDVANDLLTPAKDGLLNSISSALPVAGVVFASLAGIMISVKFFKRITGART